ncbi:hypothetical protein [Pedobacter frigoris]|uniref:DUF4890 domain-containing protein n=1 Tax=Pedobacter frigoris TaxID=2571272 RepID=A0A4U1CJL9_9SPHI|nr:hypothetical protein [Pedobacter frigoris]TKC06296.1 hypothetical protein FA047_13355 [Pedobacter frigoris]
MRKLILSAILFIGMGTMAFAQQNDQKRERKTPEEKAQRLTDVLGKKLSLTADQKTKIYAINLEGIKEQKGRHVKGQKPDRSLLKAEFSKRDGQINAVLNDNQRKVYQDWKTEKMNSMKDGKKDGRKLERKKVDKV